VIYELLGAALDQIRIGGWVMYPLVITCLWMWYLIIKKIMDLHYFTQGWHPVMEVFRNAGKPGLKCATWQRNIISVFVAEKSDDARNNQRILESIRIAQELFVKRDVGTIALLATIAPLLGLLGTVGGMIKTFTVIAEFGTGNAKELAGGISEALLTTQTGLVVAVPGLFMATFLARRSNSLLERMKRFCLRVARLNAGGIN
jgi:biopolymer transport protein ExbB